MMDIAIGYTYHDRQMNLIHVVDIAEDPNKRSKVVLYKKNRGKKVLQSFRDVLMETIQRKECVQ